MPRVLLLVLVVLVAPSLPETSVAADAFETHRDILTQDSAQPKAQKYARFKQWSGLQIMREAQRRHEQFPYVYEEQTMVLMDAKGHRSVRQSRRFSRTDDDNSAKFLLIFDDPEEIRGVALLAVRDARGQTEHGVYLPAFGGGFKQPAADARNGNFLGTDFSVGDLTTETLDEHRYVRNRDRVREGIEFFVIDAYPANAPVERNSGYGLRRHLLRKDIFMIVQTDFFDRQLRFMKRLTHHDLKQVNGESWRANMIVVSDERENHRTLLKIDRRIYSRDYVPAEIFDRDFILAHGHLRALGDRITGRLSRAQEITKADKAKVTAKAKARTKARTKGKGQGKGAATTYGPATARSAGQ